MINIILLLIIYTGLGLVLNRGMYAINNNWHKLIGESFFIGIFIVVFINNLSQYFSYNLNQTYFFYIAIFIASLAFFLYFLRTVKSQAYSYNEIKLTNLTRLELLLLLIVIVHTYLIIKQNILLPLTPWDAWSTWVAKAKIWHYYGISQVIVNETQWLQIANSMTNKAAHYPDGLSLIYTFNSAIFGWNETKLNAIYPAMFIALLLVFYGHIKILINRKYALIATFILATMPFVNIQIILAGYADIWIAIFLTLIIFNLQHMINGNKNKFYLLNVVIFSLAILMFKLESWAWLPVALLAFIFSKINQTSRRFIYLFLVILITIWYISGGFQLNLFFGELVFTPEVIKIPFIGDFKLTFVNTTSAWLKALFISKNWYLLWFSIPVVIYMLVKLESKINLKFPAFFLIIATFFLFVLFNMTYASKFATSFTSINRLILHVVPVYIYFILQVFYQYQNPDIET